MERGSPKEYHLKQRLGNAGSGGGRPTVVPAVKISRARHSGGEGERYAICQTAPTLALFDLGGESRAVTLVIVQDAAGTLCARDGIKTGPGCPNGQDAWDGKLIVEARVE